MKRLGWTALAASTSFTLIALADAPAAVSSLTQSKPPLPEVLQKSIAYYATLTSYSDTGTMLEDAGGVGQEGRFTTYFRRASRDFIFDYQLSWWRSGTLKTDATDRVVLWMFKNQMERYQQPPGTHDVINPENGGQVRGMQSMRYLTKGAALIVPSLLYSQAKLPGTPLLIEEAELAGTEDINKHRCHKIIGVAAEYYPSGQRTSIRQVTVWIDVETQLIRRVFEDTPKGYGSGSGAVDRYTFTFEPQANPAIDDAMFQFKVPRVR